MGEGGPIPRRQGMAMGQGNIGYGHMGSPTGGRNPGFAKGGHVAHKGNRHVPTAGHHNMDGHIGHGAHGHGHKAHGHTEGVPMHGQKAGGVGAGGASGGPKQNAERGPSDNQFGEHMPSGGSLGRW